LGADGKRNSRQLVFLAVVALHGAVVLLLLRATHQFQAPERAAAEPLVFLLLHSRESAPSTTAAAETPLNSKGSKRTPSTPAAREPSTPQLRMPQLPMPPSDTAPKIDWQQEAELTALNGVANADRERNYRNLGGLSDAQLKWVRDNHMVQMEPGIVWAHPRVEIDKATLIPIVHINDHCVLVLVFVFCSVGHITPNSHLLDHMHDAPAQ
jgi:hypothetical protein